MGGGMGPGMMGHGGMMGPGMMGGGMMGGSCPMMGGAAGGMMGGAAGGAVHADGRVAFLKAELAITDAQTAPWNAYATALKKSLEGRQAMHESMAKVMAANSPVERIDAQLAAMETRVASLKEMKPALTALYEALSPDQRKKADELLPSMGMM
jgi:hypothetical protein